MPTLLSFHLERHSADLWELWLRKGDVDGGRKALRVIGDVSSRAESLGKRGVARFLPDWTVPFTHQLTKLT